MEDFKASDVNDNVNEKGERSSIQAAPDRNGTLARTTNRELDRARQYILDSSVTESNASAVDLRALRSKIDWRIVPIMFCCYTMQFVDKVLLNVSWIHIKSLIWFADLIQCSLLLSWVCPSNLD